VAEGGERGSIKNKYKYKKIIKDLMLHTAGIEVHGLFLVVGLDATNIFEISKNKK
jgi:hypothetical protein